MMNLLILSISIGGNLELKYALEISKNISLSSQLKLLKDDNKDLIKKHTIRSNIAEVEKEKKEVWKDAYKKEINKGILEKITYVLIAVLSALAGASLSK